MVFQYSVRVVILVAFVLSSTLLSLLTIPSAGAVERRTVTVAAYEFPPYYSARETQDLTTVLVDQLNLLQEEFYFVVREIRPSERYQALSPSGCCDIMFFEAKQWGWPESRDYVWGSVLTRGTERFYALAKRLEAGEVNFERSDEQRIGGVLGYHYEFTSYNTDRETLERNYNLYTADTQASLVHMLNRERLEIAVLTDEYVRWRQHRAHQEALRLAGAEVADHHYYTHYILKRSGLLSLPIVEGLLQRMRDEGILKQLFQDFDIHYALLYGSDSDCEAQC